MTDLWDVLLAMAQSSKPELAEILQCLRDAGAALEADADYGLVIRPGECPRAEYEEFRAQHLVPRRPEIMGLLHKAAVVAQIKEEIKEVEPRLLSLGWASREIWSERPWDDKAAGRRKSLYATLLDAIGTWGGARVGKIGADSIEIVVCGGHNYNLRLYRASPAAQSHQSEPAAVAKEETG